MWEIFFCLGINIWVWRQFKENMNHDVIHGSLDLWFLSVPIILESSIGFISCFFTGSFSSFMAIKLDPLKNLINNNSKMGWIFFWRTIFVIFFFSEIYFLNFSHIFSRDVSHKNKIPWKYNFIKEFNLLWTHYIIGNKE